MLQPNGKTFHLQLSMLELQWLEGIDRPFTTKNTLLSKRTNIGGKTNLLLQYSCCISLLKTKNNLGKQTTSWKMHACRACSNDEKNMTKCNLHQEKKQIMKLRSTSNQKFILSLFIGSHKQISKIQR